MSRDLFTRRFVNLWKKRFEIKKQEWPEYKKSTAIIDCPSYLRSGDGENDEIGQGRQWMSDFSADVQCLQEHLATPCTPFEFEDRRA